MGRGSSQEAQFRGLTLTSGPMAWAEARTGTTRVTEIVFLEEAQCRPPSQGPDHRPPGSSCPVLLVPVQPHAPSLLLGLKPLFCTCHPCAVCLFMPPVYSFSTCPFVSLSGPLLAGLGVWGLAGSAASGLSLPWAASEHAAVAQAGSGGSWLSPPPAGSQVQNLSEPWLPQCTMGTVTGCRPGVSEGCEVLSPGPGSEQIPAVTLPDFRLDGRAFGPDSAASHAAVACGVHFLYCPPPTLLSLSCRSWESGGPSYLRRTLTCLWACVCR